jgi:5-methylcytosine-specific restriction endonuclease McrA
VTHFKKRAITAQERRDIASRFGCSEGGAVPAKCVYCGAEGSINWVKQERGKGWVQFIGLEIEHSIPEFGGGRGGENLTVACLPCNRAKGPRTVEQWQGV